MAVRSSAAGEMQVRTVSSYVVSAGTTYQVFADSAGVVPERIGIRWLNASGTEISITWSLTTLGSSSAWHRVGVAGAAPAGAANAQVLLSSTETAVAVYHFWENVYLGLPIRVLGNLLPFGTESSEVDASGWTAVVNATVTRQVPVVGWAVDNYTAGGHTLAMTAVAAGNASVLAVDRPAVTPGVEYLALAYLQPPVIASAAWIELRFYDAADNQVGAARSTLAAPGTGMYRQRASAVAPSNAATCSVAAGLDGASAGQILRLETVVITVAPELQAGTLVPYADGSFEQGIAGWTTASGAAVLSRTTPWGAVAYYGAYALTIASATATASTIRSARFPLGDGAGLNHRAALYAHVGAGSWSSLLLRVRWYDAANTDLGASVGTSYPVPAGSWLLMTSDAVAPTTATQAAVEFVATVSSTSSVLHVDAVALWQVLPLTAVEAVDAGGYVEVTLRELTVGYELSVYRELPDGSRQLVRGPSGLIGHQAIASDLMLIEDHEAPLNTSIRYVIEQWPPGSLSSATRTSDYVTLSLADINEAWLKDPGNPQRNLKVLVQTAPEWSRPIEQAVHRVRGRRNAVVLSGVRGGLEGDLAIWTRTDEERRALHLLLDSGNVLLWQAAPGMGVDDMYVNVAAVSEARIGTLAQDVWRAWTLPLIEADMPVTTGVNGAAGRTWQDVLTEFDTCADVLATYATCEDLLLDRRG
ncbi:hypothetical protein [Streptomyces acidicola]|uniref:hypothetical protein n=1 Tax=Streptomyces acidicola TaxID=2596892 RepID=UPI001D150B5E|nr:hypothetical protein [Streptomyces acidicola]